MPNALRRSNPPRVSQRSTLFRLRSSGPSHQSAANTDQRAKMVREYDGRAVALNAILTNDSARRTDSGIFSIFPRQPLCVARVCAGHQNEFGPHGLTDGHFRPMWAALPAARELAKRNQLPSRYSWTKRREKGRRREIAEMNVIGDVTDKGFA